MRVFWGVGDRIKLLFCIYNIYNENKPEEISYMAVMISRVLSKVIVALCHMFFPSYRLLLG